MSISNIQTNDIMNQTCKYKMKVPALIFKDKSDLGNTAGLPLKNCNLGSVKDIVYAKLGFKAMSTVVGTWKVITPLSISRD